MVEMERRYGNKDGEVVSSRSESTQEETEKGRLRGREPASMRTAAWGPD